MTLRNLDENRSDKFAIQLHLVTMRLGAMILLTGPTLLKVISDLNDTEKELPGERTVNIARMWYFSDSSPAFYWQESKKLTGSQCLICV